MKLRIFVFLFPIFAIAQGYTSYFTGNPTDITTTTQFGVCLMGGATEYDNAMIWLLQKANGGDVVVLRTSGSNEYNTYLYSGLGVNVNSVETLVITSVAGATNPYVLDKVAKAEMIWFADGDQYSYVSYFKDNALENLINNHVNAKHAPIGGIGAGMGILGARYFTAQNGDVTSAEALNNPYHPKVTVEFGENGINEFLRVPFLGEVFTDSHYDNPDRKGRHLAFMARINMIVPVKGIGCDENIAVCIGNDKIAHVYGDNPGNNKFAYFIQPSCNFVAGYGETCQPGVPLSWSPLYTYKVPATPNGTHYFDLNNWGNAIGSGGIWEDWSVVNGVLYVANGIAPDCTLGNEEFAQNETRIFPNPFTDRIEFKGVENATVTIFDGLGKKVYSHPDFGGQSINTASFSSGLYFVRIEKEGIVTIQKLIKY